MKIFFPACADSEETRTALTTATAARYAKLGIEVVAHGSLYNRGFDFSGALRHDGADFPACDIIATLGRPTDEMLAKAPKGAVWVGLIDPFADADPSARYAKFGQSAIAMEFLPRVTLAQKMDALSSQASLAGYAAVIKASELLDKAFPMMMTAAGTIQPARIFIIGVGVAGLQAIATAKRLGARVDAFDTRPVVEEQVRSLGAKFIKIDIGETGQTAGGYAVQLTPEQLAKQKEGMAREIAQSDVVITTAKVFGKKPPLLVNAEALAGMHIGSVVIDLACTSDGVGNVEGAAFNRVVQTANGVKIFGAGAVEREVWRDASEMYASNLASLIEHFYNAETKSVVFDKTNELLAKAFLNPTNPLS
jgi:NAD(P) transhydrogenase subunit alpha